MIVNKYQTGGGGSGSGYTLPIASASRLGGIKVGDGLSINPITGILSTSGNSEGGDSHILLSSSAAPASLSEGDVWAEYVPAVEPVFNDDFVSTGENNITYDRYGSDNPQAIRLSLADLGDTVFNFKWADVDWDTMIGFSLSNGEFAEVPNEWSGSSTHLDFIANNWVVKTNGKSVLHADIHDGYVYFYTDEPSSLWIYGVVDNSTSAEVEEGTVTPGHADIYNVYQSESGVSKRMARAEDLPTEEQLLITGETSDRKFFRSDRRWVAVTDVVQDGLRFIGGQAEGKVLMANNAYTVRWADPSTNALSPSDELPQSTSYVWETYVDDTFRIARETCTSNGDYLIHWNNSENYSGARIANGVITEMPYGGDWQIGADGKYHSGLWAGFTCWTEDGKLYWEGVPNVISMLDAYDTGSDKEGSAGGSVVIPDDEGTVRATSGGTYQVIDGEWKQLGGYDIDGALCIWNPDAGYTAEWFSPLTALTQEGANGGTGLLYAEIPENQVLFEAKYGANVAISVIYANKTLSLTDTGGTVISAITIGSDFEFSVPGSSVRKVIGRFQNHYIGVRVNSNSVSFQNIWDGSVNGGHYELVDKANYPYIAAEQGIVKWNDKGQIIGKVRDVTGTDFYVNTTASTSTVRTTLLMSGSNHMPSRFFVPTSGGDEGQVLTSAGENAAPVWATMIKALQITSADYEALAVKDPNTLYLIVD